MKYTHFMSYVCLFYACSSISSENNQTITMDEETGVPDGFCVVTSRNSQSVASSPSSKAIGAVQSSPRSQSTNLAEVSQVVSTLPVSVHPLRPYGYTSPFESPEDTVNYTKAYSSAFVKPTTLDGVASHSPTNTPFPSPNTVRGELVHKNAQAPHTSSSSIPTSTNAAALAGIHVVPIKTDGEPCKQTVTENAQAPSTTGCCLGCLRCCLPACLLKKMKKR